MNENILIVDDEKEIADLIEVYTVAKASKKAVASEWNISEASLPISATVPSRSPA